MTIDAREVGERLAALYGDIHRSAMRGLPICNDALSVEAVGFREFGEFALGVVVTPWFANLVAARQDAESPLAGAARLRLRLPAGDVEFDLRELEGFGRLASCSLFSPMSEFVDCAAAREAAHMALDALFCPDLLERDDERAPRGREGMDRRALFAGRRRTPRDEAAP